MKNVYWIVPALMGLVVTAFVGPVHPDATLAFLPALLAAGSIGLGIIGALKNASAEERAQMANDKAVQEWLKINVPDPEQQKLALQHFVQQGVLTPELENAIKLEDTQLNKIKTDPALKESRMRALKSLEEQGYGGETAADEASQQKVLIDSGVKSRGQQEAILSSLERRGQLGTGVELAARMGAAQGEGDRAASQGLELEKQRRARALAAIEAGGNQAGNIQRDEYGMEKDKAAAADVINAYNAKNLQGVQERNTNVRNRAAESNLNRAQDIADKNTVMSNYQQEHNKDLYQKQFNNEAAKAAGVSGQYGKAAELATRQGQTSSELWGNLAQGAAKVGASVYGASKKDEDEDLY